MSSILVNGFSANARYAATMDETQRRDEQTLRENPELAQRITRTMADTSVGTRRQLPTKQDCVANFWSAIADLHVERCLEEDERPASG